MSLVSVLNNGGHCEVESCCLSWFCRINHWRFKDSHLLMVIVLDVLYICVVVAVLYFLNPFFPNNGGGQIYLIMLEIILAQNLHLKQLLASLSFSSTLLYNCF